jgi:hypothetical protein
MFKLCAIAHTNEDAIWRGLRVCEKNNRQEREKKMQGEQARISV